MGHMASMREKEKYVQGFSAETLKKKVIWWNDE